MRGKGTKGAGKGGVVLGAREQEPPAVRRVYGFFGRIVMIHRVILEKEQPCFVYTFCIMQMVTLCCYWQPNYCFIFSFWYSYPSSTSPPFAIKCKHANTSTIFIEYKKLNEKLRVCACVVEQTHDNVKKAKVAVNRVIDTSTPRLLHEAKQIKETIKSKEAEGLDTSVSNNNKNMFTTAGDREPVTICGQCVNASFECVCVWVYGSSPYHPLFFSFGLLCVVMGVKDVRTMRFEERVMMLMTKEGEQNTTKQKHRPPSPPRWHSR